MSTEHAPSSPRPWENCLICDAPRPTGHVVIYGLPGDKREGVVCSSHTLKELILDPEDRFYLSIIMDNHAGGVDALERAQAKRVGTDEARRARYTSASEPGKKGGKAQTG